MITLNKHSSGALVLCPLWPSVMENLRFHLHPVFSSNFISIPLTVQSRSGKAMPCTEGDWRTRASAALYCVSVVCYNYCSCLYLQQGNTSAPVMSALLRTPVWHALHHLFSQGGRPTNAAFIRSNSLNFKPACIILITVVNITQLLETVMVDYEYLKCRMNKSHWSCFL